MAYHNEVVAVDIGANKIAKLKQKISPIADVENEDFVANKSLNFTSTLDKQQAYQNADYVIISTRTDYDPVAN